MTALTLGWLRLLPEAGDIVKLADDEQRLIDKRAELARGIASIDAKLETIRDKAHSEARMLWRSDEIVDAKERDEWRQRITSRKT